MMIQRISMKAARVEILDENKFKREPEIARSWVRIPDQHVISDIIFS